MIVRKRIAETLRTLAVIAVHLAEKLDEQPPVPRICTVHPFEVRTSTGTVLHDLHITWHTQ